MQAADSHNKDRRAQGGRSGVSRLGDYIDSWVSGACANPTLRRFSKRGARNAGQDFRRTGEQGLMSTRMSEDEQEALVSLLRSHGRMLINFGGEYVLKAFEGVVNLTDGHLGEAWTMCFIALHSMETEARPRVWGLNAAVPETVLRPVRTTEIARATGVPYETARRYVLSLVERGACVRSGDGYVPSEAFMTSEPVVQNMIRTIVHLHVMIRKIEESGMMEFIKTKDLDKTLLSLLPEGECSK